MSDAVRSVVLVTVDSLRADHCGYLEAESEATPTLDAMAESGTAFTNAVAPGPSTYESLPAIVTGEPMCAYPTGGGDPLETRRRRIALNTRRPTVAEWFAERGYTTGAFTTNPYTAGHTNFARGFDRYEDFLDGGEGALMARAAHLPVVSELKHLVTLLRGDRAAKPWRGYVEDVREWVAGADEPYFLWVFLLDPHTPYLPPPAHRPCGRLEMLYRNWRLWAAKKWGRDVPPDGDSLRELYAGAVRSADDFLGELRSFLPGDPAVCVHADHGEAFGEHGSYGHERYLYEENVHVPLVIDGGPDRTVDRPVSLTTVPDLLRAAAREELSGIPGRSGGYAMARTFDAERVAVRGRDWKYVAETDGRGDVADETVFDLSADPGERDDRSEAHPALAAGCRDLVRRRLSHEREAAAVHRAAGEVGR